MPSRWPIENRVRAFAQIQNVPFSSFILWLSNVDNSRFFASHRFHHDKVGQFPSYWRQAHCCCCWPRNYRLCTREIGTLFELLTLHGLYLSLLKIVKIVSYSVCSPCILMKKSRCRAHICLLIFILL